MKLSFPLSIFITFIATVPIEVLAAKGGMTKRPSSRPSRKPSSRPSSRPSLKPSSRPSSRPSLKPSAQPSSRPSLKPSSQPSSRPSLKPSAVPSSMPSGKCDVLDKAKELFAPGIELCYGVDLNENEISYLDSELESISLPYSDCIDSATGVQAAIDANEELIILCPGTIVVTSTIVMDYKRFDMRCLEAPTAGVPACTFDGQGTVRLFKAQTGGENVKFYGIGFNNGRVTGSVSGGAGMDFVGAGKIDFDSCRFENNWADFNGGALSIGTGSKVSVVNCRFINNKASGVGIIAGRGGAIYVGITVSLTASSLSVIGSTFSGNVVLPSTGATAALRGQGPNIFRATGAGPITCGGGNSFDTAAIVTGTLTFTTETCA